VAWGCDLSGQRVLLDVSLGQRERYEDWLEMGRGLVRRGLWAPTSGHITQRPAEDLEVALNGDRRWVVGPQHRSLIARARSWRAERRPARSGL
jgi:hypothetical protein